jgi:hypothetical protein
MSASSEVADETSLADKTPTVEGGLQEAEDTFSTAFGLSLSGLESIL